MSTCYSRNFRTIGRKTSIFERLTESYNFVRSAQGLLGMIFVAGKQFNVRSSINADPLPNTGIWIWWDNQMELEKEKYSTKDSLWGIVINVNKKYIKLNNYIIFSPFFFITQIHFHAYIECFWTCQYCQHHASFLWNVVFGWRSLIHRQKQILYDRSFEKCWFKPDWGHRGHAKATALSSSPVVSALGSESDDPCSSPGRGKALCPWDVRGKKKASSAFRLG